MSVTQRDEAFLALAKRIGQRHLGRTAPNPSVGCVLVSGSRVLASGVTAPGGRPHAEAAALAALETAQEAASTSIPRSRPKPRLSPITAYVSLEPCLRCSALLAKAGISRLVYAAPDPHPKAAGQGLALLRQAAVEILTPAPQRSTQGRYEFADNKGVRGFLTRQQAGRPFVVVKVATSLDGFMALPNGESQWITGAAARRRGQLLRAQCDALVTGSGTILRDDPQLSVRLTGLEATSPRIVILDRRGRVPAGARVFRATPGVERLSLASWPAVLAQLAQAGYNEVLVEAGAELTRAVIASGLWDELAWFQGSQLLGAGQSPFASLNLQALTAAPRLQLLESCPIEGDHYRRYRRLDPSTELKHSA